jgi:hypothetical protein
MPFLHDPQGEERGHKHEKVNKDEHGKLYPDHNWLGGWKADYAVNQATSQRLITAQNGS